MLGNQIGGEGGKERVPRPSKFSNYFLWEKKKDIQKILGPPRFQIYAGTRGAIFSDDVIKNGRRPFFGKHLLLIYQFPVLIKPYYELTP